MDYVDDNVEQQYVISSVQAPFGCSDVLILVLTSMEILLEHL